MSRLARVVSWLEDLASNALDREEAALQRAGGARLQFSEREGLPFETSEATQQRGSKARQDLVTELDPDAATRCITETLCLEYSNNPPGDYVL